MIEHGHLDEVAVQACNGDWYCAKAWAQALIEQGRRDAALDVLVPFTEAGWWGAAVKVSEILEGSGRTDEAIALARPYAADGERLALAYLARLLARHGRGDEAFELLRPHTKDWFLAEALVDVSAGLGRDEEAADLLTPHVEALRGADVWRAEPSNAMELLAMVRERQGRVDEAVALLHTRCATVVNGQDLLADLLARHDRLTELRDCIAGPGGEDAAHRLAQLLEDRGDAEGALDVLRPFVVAGSPNAAVWSAETLTRLGRVDEAVEVLRPVPGHIGDPEWVVRMLWTLLADHGREDEALTFIDDLAARSDGMWFELFCERAWLLSHCGRIEQAITELRARPEADTWYGASHLADLLATAG
ncbi:tetratricopeptide repeat protein [Streptomyces sp. NPDC056987]|uniref:tetratricopeptide repeat protein n=1 Tax=Streptomyces sp. NPDC056987 TaxID=3345988 RepID=UPI0036256384